MNRYPAWKYVIIGVSLAIGFLYTLPNFFRAVPAVQIASAKATVKVDASMKDRVAEIFKRASIADTGIFFDDGLSPSVRVRVTDDDTQLKAKDVLQKELNPDPSDPVYVVALNLISSSPQ